MRLMALSWSTNPLKGGHVYTWLDQHLDFSRFEMTFIGKCDLTFRISGASRRLQATRSGNNCSATFSAFPSKWRRVPMRRWKPSIVVCQS